MSEISSPSGLAMPLRTLARAFADLNESNEPIMAIRTRQSFSVKVISTSDSKELLSPSLPMPSTAAIRAIGSSSFNKTWSGPTARASQDLPSRTAACSRAFRSFSLSAAIAFVTSPLAAEAPPEALDKAAHCAKTGRDFATGSGDCADAEIEKEQSAGVMQRISNRRVCDRLFFARLFMSIHLFRGRFVQLAVVSGLSGVKSFSARDAWATAMTTLATDFGYQRIKGPRSMARILTRYS